ncbi:MAG: hypothetical protein CVT88_02045 [Candidatus Altiarchaeales archaeon HGW-Altiarchaeales-1]|nr:MAG: hypothetical protein CVT89_03455 [Candidatus Altiarchaeales archaeon HGW-Altiarchaeales-2]PKP60783.1 MAG: hypothetical protein CVT88_02045 [Candidatus Altiarchaeales archaeon HGW-Altiarchaeales-1]
MNIFITYNTKDKKIVEALKSNLNLFLGLKTNIFVNDTLSGKSLSEKIRKTIGDSDIVIVLLTKKGSKSISVNQEMSYAKSAGKKIIPIVEKGVNTAGMPEDIEYILFDRTNPLNSIEKSTQILENLKTEKEILSLIISTILFIMVIESTGKK